MALNFRIHAKEVNNQYTTLQLVGDFDAASACELIHILDKNVRTSRKVDINTDGLKKIYDFGIAFFTPKMARLNHSQATIQVTGRFSDIFTDA